MAVNEKKIKLYIQAEIAEAEARLKKFVNSQKNIKKQNDTLKESFSKIGGIIASAFSVQAITRFASEAVKLGSQSIALERGFLNLGKAIGINENSLNKFRQATNGTVSDVDLMIQANNAMLLGIVQSDDEFAELVDSAQRLAQALGKDTLYGIESLTTGIGRQSRLMLDNLGIIVKAEDAYKALAKATGKSVEALTDEERKQAFITATMESVRKKVADLGAEQLTAASSTQQLSASLDNLKASIGKELQDEIETTSSFLTIFLNQIDNSIKKQGLLKTILNPPGTRRFGAGVAAPVVPLPDRPLSQIRSETEDILGNFEEFEMEAIDFVASFQNNVDLLINKYVALGNAVESTNDKISDSNQKSLEDSLRNSAIQGKLSKEQTISHIRNKVQESSASHIANIFKSVPFPLDIILAAGAQAAIAGIFNRVVSKDSFATGGSFVTNKRTTLPIGNGLVVGDNASGMERVDITPLPAPIGNDRNINIYISAPLVDETVVDHIIPAIRRAEKLGL